MVFTGIVIIAVFITGVLTGKPAAIAGSGDLLVVAHCIRYNSMMAYVEKKAYDGNGRHFPTD